MLVIFLPDLAQHNDLTDFYTQLFKELVESGGTPVQIRGIGQAIDILMPNAALELKGYACEGIVKFIQSFSTKTNLNVVELL